MFINFLKIAIRSLLRQKGYTFINIAGLSIGIASAMLIFMFVNNELNFDSFHLQAKNIYRVYLKTNIGGKYVQAAWTPAPLSAILKNDFPEVRQSVRMEDEENILITIAEKYYMIRHLLYADSSFFDVFTFHLKAGEAKRVLAEPRTVVLTEATARKFFGDKDPINKMIRIESDTSYYRITGIVQDPPVNSHFEFDMLVSLHSLRDSKSSFWLSNSYYTYVLLPENYPYHALEDKFPGMINKYIGPQLQEILGVSFEDFEKKGTKFGYGLQPLMDIHMNTTINHGLKPSNNKKYLYIFSLIGAFIIIIAGINFMNLSTARSASRAREVGIRKVLGSDRKKLIGQFLTESILISLFSLAISIILLELLLPDINRMMMIDLTFGIFRGWQLAVMLIGFAVLIGVLAGSYPAFLISRFSPTSIFRNKLKMGGKGNLLRSLLVIVQFFIAIVILSGTLIVYKQLKFMQEKDLGFEKDRVLVIERAGALKNQIQTFIAEVKKFPEIENATFSSSIPGFPNSDNGFLVEGKNATSTYILYTNWVDYSFMSTFRFKIATGRFFSADMPSDSGAIVVNEAAVKRMDLKSPVGTRLLQPRDSGKFYYLPIIGVVKDFHFRSLHSAIEPYAILINTPKMNTGGLISVRVGPGDLNKVIKKIENSWKQFTSNQPMEYSFLDDRLNTLYKEEKRTGSLSLTFTILVVLIACLGLLGLISFTTVQRTKEIGIRKIMGATAPRIVQLISLETVWLIIISSLLAWPVAYIFLKNWLSDFAYKVGLNPMVFISTTLIIFILSIITIGYQAIYSATRNPADSLRYE